MRTLMLDVQGRQGGRRSRLVGEATVSADGVTLRVDDELDPGMWVQVTLTRELLLEVLARIDQERLIEEEQ